nr:putative reverse transcriptase domain-containing protein [Tanacetum cinerariifolium]
MENVPPPNNNPNAPEEEPIMDQAPAALVGFAPQWIGEQILDNNNGWLEEEPEEEEENKAMVNDKEDDAKVIKPYEEADPHNRPPPTSDEETEFAPHSVHREVKRLSKQMHDMYRTKKKMAKMLKQDELRRNGQEFDITALDSAVRANRFENLKMMRLITDLSRKFTELKNQNRRAEELSRWEAWMLLWVPERMKMLTLMHLGIHNLLSRVDPYVIHKSCLQKRSQTNPQLTLTQEDVNQLVRDGIEVAIRNERERFHGTEGAVELVCWFEKIENTFEISKYAEGRKVKFATATLHGRALTWWNSQVATLGREVANGTPWAKVKRMMTDEFCPTEEVKRLEDELRHLKLRDMNIAAYIERFKELALLCLDAIPNEKKKVELCNTPKMGRNRIRSPGRVTS